MSYQKNLICDGCGAVKKETNHWFLAYSHSLPIVIYRLDQAPEFIESPRHYCGHSCALQAVSKWLEDPDAQKV